MTVDTFVELLESRHGSTAKDEIAAQEAAKIPYLKLPTYREYPVENEQALPHPRKPAPIFAEEAYRKVKGEREIEPGHEFEIEPYKRLKHGDEIDMLMDGKGTTQRFKIGEDGQPIFPKSDAMGPETVRELAKSLEATKKETTQDFKSRFRTLNEIFREESSIAYGNPSGYEFVVPNGIRNSRQNQSHIFQ